MSWYENKKWKIKLFNSYFYTCFSGKKKVKKENCSEFLIVYPLIVTEPNTFYLANCIGIMYLQF